MTILNVFRTHPKAYVTGHQYYVTYGCVMIPKLLERPMLFTQFRWRVTHTQSSRKIVPRT